jgi:hypothetical protein
MAGLVLSSYLASGSAQAIPLPSEDFSLDPAVARAIAHDPLLKYSGIFKDHATNVLYVGPAAQKVQGGQFQQVAALECSRYNRLYDLTYTLPPSNERALAMARAGETTGPYFDHLYFHYVFFHDFIIEAYNSSLKILEWQEEHTAEIAELGELKARVDNLEGLKAPKQEKIDELDLEIKKAELAVLRAETPAAYDDAVAKLDEVTARNSPQIEALEDEIADIDADLYELTLERDILQATLDATKPLGFDEAAELASKARRAMNDLNVDANEAHKHLVAALNEVENKTVGYANAAYTVWDNEQSRLGRILANNRQPYTAQRLPLFNAEFTKLSIKEHEQIMERSGEGDEVIGADAEYNNISTVGLKVPSSSQSFPKMAFGSMADTATGAILDIGKLMQKPRDEEFGFRALVTRGLYCSGRSERTIKPTRWSVRDGYAVSFPRVIPPRQNQKNVIAQPVKLTYEYYQKTDPIGVTCTLDISKFERFARDVGNTRFLFWGKKWDHASRTRINNNGLACTTDINPQTGKPSVDKDRALDIYQMLMQDMAADYVLNFASDYDVIATQPTGDILPEGSKYTEKVGPAMQALCGGNLYCQIANVTFMALENIIDVSRGDVSRVDTQSGSITRKYSERSYTKVKGESTFKVEVSL